MHEHLMDTLPRKSRLRYLRAYIPDIVLIVVLLVSIYIYHDALLNIWCIPIYLLLAGYTIIRLLKYRRHRRRAWPSARAELVHIAVLMAVLIATYWFYPTLSLAKEIIQYSRSRSDFDRLAIIANTLCSAQEANFEVDLAPDITQRHGWKKARVTTDGSGAHFVILFNRPDPSAGYGSVGGTAFVYAQQKQKLGQRISTSAAILYCHHYLGGGWLACVISS